MYGQGQGYGQYQQQPAPPQQLGQQPAPPQQLGQGGYGGGYQGAPPPGAAYGQQQAPHGYSHQSPGYAGQHQAPGPTPSHQGMLCQGQPPPPQSQHYGDYGQQFSTNVFQMNAAIAMGYQSGNELKNAFDNERSHFLNGIQGEELQRILNNTPKIKHYFNINWSLELCKIMIAMLDRTTDGIMQYEEFEELLKCLTYWHQTFIILDTNKSGYIEAGELFGVITHTFCYQLSQAAMTTILKRYSKAMDDGRCLLAFDDFVALSVRLRAYTEAFRARDRKASNGFETGSGNFTYDDFLCCVMCL